MLIRHVRKALETLLVSESLQNALLDVSTERLRPVMITVTATVVTLLLVPVIYIVCVENLKWITWQKQEPRQEEAA